MRGTVPLGPAKDPVLPDHLYRRRISRSSHVPGFRMDSLRPVQLLHGDPKHPMYLDAEESDHTRDTKRR